MNRLPPEKREDLEIKFDQTPRADFAKVKESLRGYGTLYPQSPYVPEAHYLLALTYEQLNQDEESVKELLVLLKEADFNPELVMNMEQGRAMRDRDYANLNKLKSIWNFWKKKTGNYLANKFFEDNEFFNAYHKEKCSESTGTNLVLYFFCTVYRVNTYSKSGQHES